MECRVLSGCLEFAGYEYGTMNAVTASGFLRLPFETKEGNFIVGFNKMELSYGNPKEDHHVREMGLKLSANLAASSKLLLLSARAYLNDDSGNHMPPKNQKLHYVVIVYPKDVSLPSTGEDIRAMSSFDIRFHGSDHHVASYRAFADAGDSYISDNSGNVAYGKSTKNVIRVPYEDYLELQASKVGLVYRFYIATKGGDHRVSHTGFEVTKEGVTFDLSDADGQHACHEICSIGCDV